MITREELVYEIAMAMSNAILSSEHIDATATAEAALDVVLKRVGEPVAELLDNPSPFGKLAADHIRKLAAK
jgi:hypothetical protein